MGCGMNLWSMVQGRSTFLNKMVMVFIMVWLGGTLNDDGNEWCGSCGLTMIDPWRRLVDALEDDGRWPSWWYTWLDVISDVVLMPGALLQQSRSLSTWCHDEGMLMVSVRFFNYTDKMVWCSMVPWWWSTTDKSMWCPEGRSCSINDGRGVSWWRWLMVMIQGNGNGMVLEW